MRKIPVRVYPSKEKLPKENQLAWKMAEVAADAALLVDPYDTGAIARAVRRMDGDPALRADLAARGRIQAAKFSREAYRQRLAQVYTAVS